MLCYYNILLLLQIMSSCKKILNGYYSNYPLLKKTRQLCNLASLARSLEETKIKLILKSLADIMRLYLFMLK